MSFANTTLLPRAKLKDVLGGRARLIGSRCADHRPRGVLSPVEVRLRMGIPYADLQAVEEEYLAHRSLKTDAGLLVRTLIACALSPSATAKPARRPFVVSAEVDNLSIEEAKRLIWEAPSGSRARMLYFVHAHALNLARFNRGYADVLAQADALFPDGIGIRMAARLLGVSLRHNLNGTDLFPILCAEAAERGVPIVLIGGAPGVAAECARRMQAANPGLQTPVVAPGFFANEAEAQRCVEQVKALGRCLVLVGMGSPKQEQWSAQHLRECAGATVLTVGGLFDFYSGRVRRAPIFWRETGLEWAYRMFQEPRRLAKRYLLGNPLFMALALEQRLFRRPAEQRSLKPSQA